ncbi:hypothetical protein MFLAVUS_010046 [Mucor flavus]|uniref:Uncharacterized protein n=1 Tax=Mucor flavus TaxID=439312 RepID=A0ABP9ZBK9_9FUNG
MPSYRHRLLNLAYIVEKKPQKLNRDVPDTTATEAQEREETYDILFSSFIYLLSEHKAEDTKRKREDDSIAAGRSTKRNTADSIGEGSTASAVESASISTDTRSTTANIRSNIATNLTLAKQLANRRARAAGKQDRDRKIKNSAARRPCPDCVKNNCYDDENPHSSRISVLCPGYIMSTANYIEENVGRGYRRFGNR